MPDVVLEGGKVVLHGLLVGLDSACCCDSGSSGGCDCYIGCPKPLPFTLLCDGKPDDGAELFGEICTYYATGFLGEIENGVYQQANSASISCTSGGWEVIALEAWACDSENYCINRYTGLVPCDGEGIPTAGAVALTLVQTECAGENWCGNPGFHEIAVELTRP